MFLQVGGQLAMLILEVLGVCTEPETNLGMIVCGVILELRTAITEKSPIPYNHCSGKQLNSKAVESLFSFFDENIGKDKMPVIGSVITCL